MATFESPYARSSITEVVPDSMKVRGLSRSSILTGRRRVRIIPQTGTAYGTTSGKPSLANILIQDSAGMLDLQSVVLSFRLKTSVANGDLSPATTAVPDDFAWSVLRRLQVSINSVLCDDIDYVAKRATAEVYGSASKAWYNSVGSIMGAWKFLGDSAGTGGTPNFPQRTGPGFVVPKNDVTDKLPAATIRFKNVIWDPAANSGAGAWVSASTDGGGQFFSIPMSMLSHFFRQESLFSLRNAGQLYIQLLFASPSEALFIGSSAQAADYSVTDLVVEADIVTAHPEYTALIDQICSMPQAEGLAYAFDSHLVSVQQVSGSGSGGSKQTFTVIASKATQNCRSLHWIMQPQSGLSTQTWLEQSTYNCNDTEQWQIRIGSVYYPAFPSQGLSKNFMELMSSYNSPSASVGQEAIADAQSWRTTTKGSGSAYSVTAPIGTGGVQIEDNQVFPYSDQYIGGYCFDNLKHAEVLSHDGVSTLAMSGSQIQLEVRCTPVESGTAVTYFIRFTRTLVLAENGTQCVG